MAATRENVLAAISQYVLENNRRAPASAIAEIVSDTLPNVQAIVKTLAGEGSINSSRGRNGGALPDGYALHKKPRATKAAVKSDEATESVEDSAPVDDDTAQKFAALFAKLEAEEASSSVASESVSENATL